MTPSHNEYLSHLVSIMWDYRHQTLNSHDDWFDAPAPTGMRPPVFLRDHADHNIAVPPTSTLEQVARIRAAIPTSRRHRHFASMRSSQALAQTAFAGLYIGGELEALSGLQDDDGITLFPNKVPTPALEYEVTHLGEPRPTSIDVFFDGSPRVAVECKLTEDAVGPCSRPALRPSNHRYEAQHCDGTHRRQRGRSSRCSLTEIGVRYWHHIPDLFVWDADVDHDPCPLRFPYQLVRNVLAATTGPSQDGIAVLVYDARNPANQPGGAVADAWSQVKRNLRNSDRLARCSWQRILHHLQHQNAAGWLIEALYLKYGLRPELAP